MTTTLSRCELAVLDLLLRRKIVSIADALDAMLDVDENHDRSRETVKVMIYRIRRKLAALASARRYSIEPVIESSGKGRQGGIYSMSEASKYAARELIK